MKEDTVGDADEIDPDLVMWAQIREPHTRTNRQMQGNNNTPRLVLPLACVRTALIRTLVEPRLCIFARACLS